MISIAMMTILTTQVKRRQFKLVQQSDMFLVGCVAKEEVSDDDDDDDSEDDDDDDNDGLSRFYLRRFCLPPVLPTTGR